MVVLVCGGRDFTDYTMLSNTLRHAHEIVPIREIIHGAAKGADTLADQWARWRNIPVRSYPADWDEHGRSAGPIRNARMLADGRPDLVVAFPGSVGTNNMVEQARKAGVRVLDMRNPARSTKVTG
jgi:hypothetical protein